MLTSPRRILARAVWQQCERALATQCGEAAAFCQAQTAQLMHLTAQPGAQQQLLQQQLDRSTTLFSKSSTWSWPQPLAAAQQAHKSQPAAGVNAILFEQLHRCLQQQFQCRSLQPLPQQEQEQSILPQQPGLQLPASSDAAAPQLPGLQLPASSDSAAPQPLLCIKRTYQPHPRRYKRKHGFLKR